MTRRLLLFFKGFAFSDLHFMFVHSKNEKFQNCFDNVDCRIIPTQTEPHMSYLVNVFIHG